MTTHSYQTGHADHRRSLNPAQRLLMFLLMLMLFALIGSAQTFEYQGINYKVLDENDNTCEVTSNKNVSGSVTIPETVYNEAVPYTVAKIGNYAFSSCQSLTELNFPISIKQIGDHAFMGSYNLRNINFAEGNPSFSSDNGVIYDKEKTTVLLCPEGKRGNVIIPPTVISIGASAFGGCEYLTGVEIPSSVSSIGKDAFHQCFTLSKVNIPASVVSIGESAFYNCRKLQEIEIPSSVTSIGDYAFWNSGLKVVRNNASITKIGLSVFFGCTSLLEVNFPPSVTYIDESAFYNCKSLTHVEIPSTVTYIGTRAFSNCTALKELYIPSSITAFGIYVFNGCTQLSSITYDTVNPTPQDSYWSFFDSSIYSSASLYVPEGATEAFKSIEPWKRFSNIVEIITPQVDIAYDSSYGFVIFNGIHVCSPYIIEPEDYSDGKLSLYIIPKQGCKIEAIELNGSNIYAVSNPDNEYVVNLSDLNLHYTLNIRFCEAGEATLTVSSPGHHTVTQEFTEGSNVNLTLAPQEGWSLHSVTLNDEPIDFTTDNKISIPSLTGANHLNAIYLQNTSTDADAIEADPVHVSLTVKGNTLTIGNKPDGATVQVYDIEGHMVASTTASTLNLPVSNEVVVVAVAGKVFKIAVR